MFEESEPRNQCGELECVNLLKAMELDDGDEMVIEDEVELAKEVQDDEDKLLLPEEWVYDLQQQRKESGSCEMLISKGYGHQEQEVTEKERMPEVNSSDASLVNEEYSCNTQPSLEVIDKSGMEEKQMRAKKGKKTAVEPCDSFEKKL